MKSSPDVLESTSGADHHIVSLSEWNAPENLPQLATQFEVFPSAYNYPYDAWIHLLMTRCHDHGDLKIPI